LEERTIHAARSGDRAALGRLLRDLQDCWYRFSLSLLGDGESAREATQETGLRFMKALPAFRGDSQLQTWSLGIALNVAREMRRKAKPLPQLAKEFLHRHRADAPAAADVVDASEQHEALRSVLSDLPDRQREAIVLRFFEEMSVEQTAATMGCAEGTVKATVHQALRSLKQRLTPRKQPKKMDSLSPCSG
jgi:RNA polymerase sigma-70 factor (ECF subfamily)